MSEHQGSLFKLLFVSSLLSGSACVTLASAKKRLFHPALRAQKKAQACSVPRSLAVATGQTKVIFLNMSMIKKVLACAMATDIKI